MTIAAGRDRALAAAELAIALEAAGDARARLRSATVEAADVDPIALVEAAREADLEVALWLQPADDFALVGIGRAWSADATGPGRFGLVGDAWRDLLGSPARAAAGRAPALPRGVGPVLLGGLGFTGEVPAPGDPWAPFGSASLALPSLTLARTPAGTFLTGALVDAPVTRPGRELARTWDALASRARELAPAPGALVARPAGTPLEVVGGRPDRAAWDRLVGLFAGAVGRGRLDKVVLARRLDLRSPLELDVPNALRRLVAADPRSTTFAVARGGATLVGATPERLVTTAGRSFRTVAVAGSAARGVGRDDDERLAAALLADDKEREEHAVVVAMLRTSLGPLAEELRIAPEPTILRLRHVQHLVTALEGTLREEAGLLALAERLHPTPAVGGEPRAAALDLIAEHEGFDRGWYAGPVGWLGVDGDGELMVALRCGVLAGRDATLFAGCGIVADSDPGREWEESRLKLRPVVSALGRLEEADA